MTLTPKRKRQPTRTPQEKLEDAFMDLTVAGQKAALATFQTLHRMKMRLALEQIDSMCMGDPDPQGSLIDGAATETGTKP